MVIGVYTTAVGGSQGTGGLGGPEEENSQGKTLLPRGNSRSNWCWCCYLGWSAHRFPSDQHPRGPRLRQGDSTSVSPQKCPHRWACTKSMAQGHGTQSQFLQVIRFSSQGTWRGSRPHQHWFFGFLCGGFHTGRASRGGGGRGEVFQNGERLRVAHMFNHGPWRLAVGGWRRLAVGGWQRLAVGGGWRLGGELA